MRLATMATCGPYYRCLWCQDPQQATPLLVSLCDKREPTWLPRMLEDLGSCFDCVIEYQRGKEDMLEIHSELKQPFYEFDIKRIRKYLESHISRRDCVSYDVIDVDGYVTVADRLRTPLLECLKYPNYLMDSRVNELFVQAFQLHSERSEDLDVDEKLPGVYLLLVHSHHQIRRWAIRTVRSLGTVSINDFDDLQLVSKWLFSVLEFGLLYHSPDVLLADCIRPWDPESTSVIPRHLFDSTKPHDFWVGVCMFLTALDAQTLRTQLISGQQQIVDTIVGVFEDHSEMMLEEMDGMSAFWPALQCFVVLLQRLESRVWSVSSRNPNDVLNFVIYNRHYQAELLAMASSDTDKKEDKEEEMVTDDDADMSNSQIAYDWDGRSPPCFVAPKVQTRSFHATLFGWFTAFLLSLVDFGDLAADQFKDIVRFLVCLPVRLRVQDSSREGAMPLLKLRCIETLLQLLEEVLYRKLNKLVAHTAHEWLPVLVSHAQVQQPSDGFCDTIKIPVHELPSFGRLARKLLLFLIKSTPEGPVKKRVIKYIPSLWTERSRLYGDERVVTIHSLSEADTKQFAALLAEIVRGNSRRQRESTDLESTKEDNLIAGMVDDAVGSPLLFDDDIGCNEPEPATPERDCEFPVNSQKCLSCEPGAMSTVSPPDCLKTVQSLPVNGHSVSAMEKNKDDLQSATVTSIENDRKYSLLSKSSSETDDDDDDDDVPLVKRTDYQHKSDGSSDRDEKVGSKLEIAVSTNTFVTNSLLDSSSGTDSDDMTVSKNRAPRASKRVFESSDHVGDSSESDEVWKMFEKKKVRKKTKQVIEISDDSETEEEFKQKTVDNSEKKSDTLVTSSQATSTPLSLRKKAILRLTPIVPFRVNRTTPAVISPVEQACKTVPRWESPEDVQESKPAESRDKDLESDCRGKSVSKFTKELPTTEKKLQTPSTKSVVDRHSANVRKTSYTSKAVHPVHTFAHETDSEMKTNEDDRHEKLDRCEAGTKSLGGTISSNGEEEREDEQSGEDYNIANYLLDDNDRDILMYFDEWDHHDPVTSDTVVRVDALSCVEADLTQQVENSMASNDIRTSNKTQTDALFKKQTVMEKMEIQQQAPVHHKQQEFKVPAIPAPRSTGATSSGKKQALPISSLPPQTGLKGAAISMPKPLAPAQISTKPRRQMTMDDLMLEILSWDPNYITQYGRERGSNFVKPPNHLTRAMRVGETFSSFQMYLDVFQPLLCLEVWEVVTKGLLAKQLKKPLFDAVVTNVHQAADQAICSVRCDGQISFVDNREWNHVVQGDLVLLKIVKSPLRPTNHPPVIAVVEFVVKQSTLVLDTSVMSQTSQGDEIGLTVTLKMRQTRWMPREKESVELKFVESLVTTMRQWVGLTLAHKNLLLRDILFPSSRQHFCSEEAATQLETLTMQHNTQKVFNESQSQAVVAATLSSLNVYSIPRICLLQGPPGTGKTHTVIGLLKTILQESQLRVNGRIHILLCAPSNGAVDELVRRLIRELNVSIVGQRGNSTSQSTSRGFLIVRVGRTSAMHPDVKPFGLNALVDQRISQEATGLQNQAMANLGAELTNIDSRLEHVDKKIMFHKRLAMTKQEQQLQIQIKRLEAQRAQLLDHRSQAEMQRRRVRGRVKDLQRHRTRIVRDIILGADVVCCTLSGSGSHSLSSVMKNRRGASALPHFSCVVVDESAQCCELDILVPLQYGSSKLILVGDPEQLPATVLSQKAESLGYGRSMFERFYSLFQKTMEKSPVLMLDMQYRMHPAICQFPSKRFYNNRLKSCSSLEQTKGWQFRPWLVYNMVKGEEECNAPGAMKNPVEAAMVVELCGVICKSISGLQIGVITPYNHQRQLISKLLKERLGQRLASEIEVNTVDGFQGREKDVILLSCVRARHRTGAIGFLSHRQRLNVALTRAKKTLVVIGHLESLRVNADWRALCDDAKERGTVVDVTDTEYGMAAKTVCLSVKLPATTNTSTLTGASDPVKLPSSTSAVSLDQTHDHQGLSTVPLSQRGDVNEATARGSSMLPDRSRHKTRNVTETGKKSDFRMVDVDQQPVRHSVNKTSCVQDQTTRQTRDHTSTEVKANELNSGTAYRSNSDMTSRTKTVAASCHHVESSSKTVKDKQDDNKTEDRRAVSSASAVMSSVTHEIHKEKISTGTPSLESSSKAVKEKRVGNQAADWRAVSGVAAAVTRDIHKDRISVTTSRIESTLPSVEAGKDSQRTSNSNQRLSLSLRVNSAAYSIVPTTSGCVSEETSSQKNAAVSSNAKTGEPEADNQPVASTTEAIRYPGRDGFTAKRNEEPRLHIAREPTSSSWLSTRSGDKKSGHFSTARKKAEKSSSTKLQPSGFKPSRKRSFSTEEPVKHLPKRPNHSGTMRSTTATVNEPTYEDMGYRVLLKPRERVAHAGAATETRRKTIIHSNYYRKSSRANDIGDSTSKAGPEKRSIDVRTANGTKSSSTDLLGSIMTDMRKRPSYG